MNRLGERLFGLLLLAYPAEFRRRYRDDLLAFFREDRRHPRYGSGLLRPLRFWIATLKDLAQSAPRARRGEGRTPRQGIEAWPERRTQRLRQPGLLASAGRHLAIDLRNAGRSLRSTPGPTFIAWLVLTLGIGASTAMFSVADAVALRALPFHDPDSLLSVSETDLRTGRPSTVAAPNFLDWTARQSSFEGLGASGWANLVLRDEDRAERVSARRVTTNLFDLLRVPPQHGRLFVAADAQPGAAAVAILSDGFWRRRFGGDPGIVGRELTFDGGVRRVVGIMPPGFTYPLGSRLVSTVDLWVPMLFTERDRARDGGRTYALSVIGRLRPGVSRPQAAAEMGRIRDDLALEHPRWFVDHGVDVQDLRAAIVAGPVRAWMLFLLGAVAFVLLIACANVANVLLARAGTRARELGIRAALGASRWDLVRGVMVESLLLAALGAGGGLLLAQAGIGILRATLPDELPRLVAVALDVRVFAVAVATGLATGVLFGMAPAVRLSRPDLAASLRDAGRSNSMGRSQLRVRAALVVAEVALAIVLLVGSGLFVVSFIRLVQRDLGFDPSGVLTVDVTPRAVPAAAGRPAPPPSPMRAHLPVLFDRLRRLPGVESVSAMTGGLPLSGSSRTHPLKVPGRAEPFVDADEPFIRETTPEYFDVMRMSMHRGRWISADDIEGAPPVVVLSDVAARRYFGDSDPVGRTVEFDLRSHTVIGVVGGTRFMGPESEAAPEAFVPLAQVNVRGVSLLLRTAASAEGTPPVAALRSVIWETVPDATISDVRTLDDYYGELIARRRFNAILISVFGVLALAIVSVGIYGVISCVVDQRTREIGVRMALGARPGGVQRMVLGRAGLLAVAGLAVGVAGAAALEQLARSFLFQPRPHDPAVYATAGLLIVAISLLAAFVPARRASRVDPLVALRRD